MNERPDSFREFRDALLAWGRRISKFADRTNELVASDSFAAALGSGEELDVEEAVRALAAVRSDLVGGLEEILSEKLRVALMGIFSVGKSSLINAMFRTTGSSDVRDIGKHPVDVDITILTFGETPGARRTLGEGKAVRIEEVTYPLELLKRITLVDTPGTDEEKIRDQAAIDYLSRVHVLVYLFMPDHVLAEGGEETFLSTLFARYAELPRLYVVTHLSEFRIDPTLPLTAENLDRAEMADWLARMNQRLISRFAGQARIEPLSLAPAGNTWFVDSHPRMTHGVKELLDYLLETYNETTANCVRRQVSLLDARNAVRDLVLALRKITARTKERLLFVTEVSSQIARLVAENSAAVARELAGDVTGEIRSRIFRPEALAGPLARPFLDLAESLRPRSPASADDSSATLGAIDAIHRLAADLLARFSRLRQEWIVERSGPAGAAGVFARSAVGKIFVEVRERVVAALAAALAVRSGGPATSSDPIVATLLSVPGGPALSELVASLFSGLQLSQGGAAADPTREFVEGARVWQEKIAEATLPSGPLAAGLRGRVEASREARRLARAAGITAALERAAGALRASAESILASPGDSTRAVAERVAARIARSIEERILLRATVRLEQAGLTNLVGTPPAELARSSADDIERGITEDLRASFEPPVARSRADLESWPDLVAREIQDLDDQDRETAGGAPTIARESADLAVGAARSALERMSETALRHTQSGYDPAMLVSDLSNRLETVRKILEQMAKTDDANRRRDISLSRSLRAHGIAALGVALGAIAVGVLASWVGGALALSPAALLIVLGFRRAAARRRARGHARTETRLLVEEFESAARAAISRIDSEAVGPVADREVVLWGELSAILEDARQRVHEALSLHVGECQEAARRWTERALSRADALASRIEALSRELAARLATELTETAAAFTDRLARRFASRFERLVGERTAPLSALANQLASIRLELARHSKTLKGEWDRLSAWRTSGEPGTSADAGPE